MLANAILDIRLHTLNMTDQEALDLMEKQTFQEHEEATGEAAAGQALLLPVADLPGGLARLDRGARAVYRSAHPSFQLHEFNDRALQQGAVPLPRLEWLLAEQGAKK